MKPEADNTRRNQASPNGNAELTWMAKAYRRTLAFYLNRLIPENSRVLQIGCGDAYLLSLLKTQNVTGIDASSEKLMRAAQRLPEATFLHGDAAAITIPGTFDYILISDALNTAPDVQRLLEHLMANASTTTRLIITYHNNVWLPLFGIAKWLGLRKEEAPSSWLSTADVNNFLKLAGWLTIRNESRILWPFKTPVLSFVLNRLLAPVLPFLNLACITIARSNRPDTPDRVNPSVSIVIPARNEAGNIHHAIERIPDMGSFTEYIFVEGNSTDNTWEEVQKLPVLHPDKKIKVLKQSGKGKGNAVREGFDQATGDILMILDADLTMPPEELPKFYHAIATGRAEFANGSRLVYPMEDKAMQFFNMVANKSFGIIFSWLLGQPIKDTLCGTKVLSRQNYLTIAANRSFFGDFDPFGDFDLLFGAGKLNLQILDIPIRYKERTYGSTNIQRWRHGVLLLRMVLFAARKLKFI